MNRISRRAQRVNPFHAMELMGAAEAAMARGIDVVHMEVGEPDFPAPAPIAEAASLAIREGRTRYTQARGMQPLREAIAGWYQSRFGVHIDPTRILVTPGASGALQLVFAVLLDTGDCIAVTDPGYPANANIARALGIEVDLLPVGPAGNFFPDARQAADSEAGALMLNSPANPTGTVLNRDHCAQLIDACRNADKAFVLDEIYQGLIYDIEPYTALALADDVWVINSFSKFFGMTGWRLGWLVVPENCVRAVERLAQNLFISPSTVSQYAALAAFLPETLEELERRRKAFQQRRDFLQPALQELGFGVPARAQGAFYLYADASAHTDDTGKFVYEMLDEAAVVATPGLDFGSRDAAKFMRFSYTTGLDRLEEGVERMRKYLRAGAG